MKIKDKGKKKAEMATEKKAYKQGLYESKAKINSKGIGGDVDSAERYIYNDAKKESKALFKLNKAKIQKKYSKQGSLNHKMKSKKVNRKRIKVNELRNDSKLKGYKF